jgi:hypothetical protein
MTPNLENLSHMISETSLIFSIDADGLFDLKEGVFWMLLTGVFVLVFLWLLFGAIIMLRLDLRFRESSCCVSLGIVGEFLLPIINNAFFLPINSLLLDVFLCTEEIGSDYTDTFLDRDCHEFCWKDDHVTYAIFACVCLIAYLPCAIYCRPYW